MSYPLLERINAPGEIKNLPASDMPALCEEIRQFLIKSVSETGGHLSSNLGVVELTVALHRVLDFPQDKLLFDVGHQPRSRVHLQWLGLIDLTTNPGDVDDVTPATAPTAALLEKYSWDKSAERLLQILEK